jgi:hypothetical protein
MRLVKEQKKPSINRTLDEQAYQATLAAKALKLASVEAEMLVTKE